MASLSVSSLSPTWSFLERAELALFTLCSEPWSWCCSGVLISLFNSLLSPPWCQRTIPICSVAGSRGQWSLCRSGLCLSLDFRCAWTSSESVRMWFSCSLGYLVWTSFVLLQDTVSWLHWVASLKKPLCSENVDLGEPDSIMALLWSFCRPVVGNNSLLCVLVTDLVFCGIPYMNCDVRQHGVAMYQQTGLGKEGLRVGQHAWEWWGKGWDVGWVPPPAARFEHQAVFIDVSTLGAEQPPGPAHGIIIWLSAMLRGS